MKIGIDIRSLLEGQRSGIAEYTLHLINHLVAVAPHHEYHLFYNAGREVGLPLFSSGVQVHRFRYPNKLFNMAQWLGHWRWDHLVSVDCFFAPSLRLIPLAPTTPLVVTVHDLSFIHFPEFFSPRRRLWHRMMRPKRLLQRANHLIAVSQTTAEDIQKVYGIAKTRVTTIHSGVSLTAVTADQKIPEAVRQRYHLPLPYILSFGTLEPRKNIAGLIKAFDAVASVIPHHLVIAGARGWLTKSIDTAWRESRFSDRIHFTGFIPLPDKKALFCGAELFVYPSFYEGFGFPPLEALVMGTPVIVSNNSALPEIVGKWALLVNPYDTAELALAIRERLAAPVRVPVAVRQEIENRYTWKSTAQKTISVLENAHAHRR